MSFWAESRGWKLLWTASREFCFMRASPVDTVRAMGAHATIPTENSAAMQRARGRIGLQFRKDAHGNSQLVDLHQSGCAKAMVARRRDPVAEAVLINTAGGLTGGDQLDIGIRAEPGVTLDVASQTAERAYRSLGTAATVHNRLWLGGQTDLAWIPQETILFDHSALRRHLEVEMSGTARLLVAESFVLGRLAMGETVHRAEVQDHWRIRRDGRLVFADSLRLGGDIQHLIGRKAVLDGAQAFASVLLVAADAEDWKDRVLQEAEVQDNLRASASAWDGMLSLRLVASRPDVLRTTLKTVLQRLRGRAMPRVWTM